MTLWNIIRDFFVQYIFGGMDSNGSTSGGGNIGNMFGFEGNSLIEETPYDTNGAIFKVGSQPGYDLYCGLGDWLSTIATIITLCAICVFLFLFVRWLFRLTAGLFQARG